MFLIYYNGMIIAPDYQRHFVDKEDAEKFVEKQGLFPEKVKICPVVIPECMGSS